MRIEAMGFSVLAGLLIWPGLAQGLDERSEMLSASVDVAPVFSLSLSNPNLAFPQISPGATETLGATGYFNEIVCRSNSGRPWYLKAQLVMLQDMGRSVRLAPRQLAWRVVERQSAMEPAGGTRGFEPFLEEPVLIYSSGGADNRGRPVVLRFQYALTIPADAPAGQYIGQLVFTMAENL